MLHPRLIGKCGGERVSFSSEGSNSVTSPVKEIIFEKRALSGDRLRSREICALPM
jgi:hypothetical protein